MYIGYGQATVRMQKKTAFGGGLYTVGHLLKG